MHVLAQLLIGEFVCLLVLAVVGEVLLDRIICEMYS